MNGKVRFEGEVAGCLYQIEPYYYVYYIAPSSSNI